MEVHSKIEARQEALSLAIHYSAMNAVNTKEQTTIFNLICIAKTFEEYIVGSAQLPEKTKNITEITNECLASLASPLGIGSMKQEEKKQDNATANVL